MPELRLDQRIDPGGILHLHHVLGVGDDLDPRARQRPRVRAGDHGVFGGPDQRGRAAATTLSRRLYLREEFHHGAVHVAFISREVFEGLLRNF